MKDDALTIHRVLSCADPEFAALVDIYTEAHPESERKSLALLSNMIERPEYFFITASHNGSVSGFAIAICFANSDAALLEYMAVASDQRGLGIGRSLFRQTTKLQPIAERFLLIEVDSDKIESADRSDRIRRKAFYRRLRCREVEGLAYIMPRVSTALPPAMELLVYKSGLPKFLEKSHLRIWLEDCYIQVYGMGIDDRRIPSMIKDLPLQVPLL